MYIKWFGTVLGWWSMIFEHKQFKLKKSCRTPKNYIKHLVIQQEQSEHLHRFRKSHNDFISQEENKFLFSFEANKVVDIAKGYQVTNKQIRKSLYKKFLFDVRKRFPDLSDSMLKESSIENTLFNTYKKIRVGNCVYSTINHSKGKKRTDCYMELRNTAKQTHSYHYAKRARSITPKVAICEGIYSLRPFNTGRFKDNVVYYIRCTELETL